MGQTSIEWSDFTFNPLWGCQRVSPGCVHCYAEAFDKRLGGKHWGPGSERRTFGEAHWKEPLKWQAKAVKDGRVYRVFCASMADWLEDHQDWIEPRARLESLVAATPNLIWLFLTKRPENWRLMPDLWKRYWPRNAMFGFTAEDRDHLSKRLEHWSALYSSSNGLVRTFVSVEPLIADIGKFKPAHYMDWIICGGESGHGARPMHPDWARSLRDQCAEAEVPFLFKQWGEWAPGTMDAHDINRNYHQFASGSEVVRVGKHKAGRLLDGVEHNGLPAYWPANVGLLSKPAALKVIP